MAEARVQAGEDRKRGQQTASDTTVGSRLTPALIAVHAESWDGNAFRSLVSLSLCLLFGREMTLA